MEGFLSSVSDSDAVLGVLRSGLEAIDFGVEASKEREAHRHPDATAPA